MVLRTPGGDRRGPRKGAPKSAPERVTLSFFQTYPRLTLDFSTFLATAHATGVPHGRDVYRPVGNREGCQLVCATAGPAAVHG
jgi:hypothetical protein